MYVFFFKLRNLYDQNSIEPAMSMQHTATYGDFRSPIRANFQNVPTTLESRIVALNLNGSEVKIL